MADAASLAFAGPRRLTELLRAGETTPRELVELYLARIDRLDPHLNAFRKVFRERALLEADQAAARLKGGDERPLLGLPVAVKDDVGVAGEVLTMGTNAAGAPEGEDWEIVRRLRAAGAIVLGITNVPELTIWPITETPTNGITRNPWDPQRTSGGSSGGSATAVAAGLVPLATASDGGGSIRIPAAACGLVGLKPQRGRIPYKPVGEGWHGLSVVGVLTRTVEDCAFAYEVLTGEPYAAAAAKPPSGLRIALSYAVPGGLRAKIHPDVRRGTEELASMLRAAGHEVVERDPDYGLATLNWGARWLRGIADDAAAMAHPERLEPRTRAMARLGRLVGRRGLERAMTAAPEDTRRINAIFDDVDLILGPGTASLPPQVGRWTGAGALRTFNGVSAFVPFQAVWNHVGNPAINLPTGWTAGGVPTSAQLVARPDGEPLLFSVAGQIEAARPWAARRPPLAAA